MYFRAFRNYLARIITAFNRTEPLHKTSGEAQTWFSKNLVDFLSKDERPPSSPDLNPLDFYGWSFMMAKLTDQNICSLEQFNRKISKIWDEMPMSDVRAVPPAILSRRVLVKRAKGGIIKKHFL